MLSRYNNTNSIPESISELSSREDRIKMRNKVSRDKNRSVAEFIIIIILIFLFPAVIPA